jgi:hypothetical protein
VLNSTQHFYKGKIAFVSIILIYTFLYSASVDILMDKDSRYYVEAWMKKNIDEDSLIGLVGLLEYLPRAGNFERKEYIPKPSIKVVEHIKPDYLIVNSDIPWGNENFYSLLNNEKLGYTLILQHRTNLKWLLLNREDIIEDGRRKIITNINKLNPEIKIFKRTD